MVGVIQEEGPVYSLRVSGFTLGFLVRSMLLILLVICVEFFALLVFVPCFVSDVACVSGLHLRISLMFFINVFLPISPGIKLNNYSTL